VDEVGRALPLNRSSTARRLDALARSGEIESQTYGQTRVYTLPRRVSLASALGDPSPLVLVLSGDLRVLEVNDPLLSVFRLRGEDLLGRHIQDTPLAAYTGDRLLREVRKGARGKAGLLETESLVGDARYTFRARITPLSSSRKAKGLVVSMEDITGLALHRRRLEGAMDRDTLELLSSNPRLVEEILQRRQEEERMRLIHSSMDQAALPALWVGRDGYLIRVNRAAAAFLGYPEEELARMAFPDLDPGMAPAAWESFWNTLKAGGSASFEGRLRTKAGDTVAVEVRASHLTHRDREFGLLLLEEITRRKEAEEALLAREAALRQANERLRLLTAVTCHDVLNDVAALGMYLELLSAETGARISGQEVAGNLDALVRSLRRRMEFARDYSDLGMKEPRWEELAGMVARAVAAMDTGALRVDLGLPALEIYADPLFERAISNLVDNTLRHGGHATFIRFRALVEEDACTLMVEDDGVGVSPGLKESIFRPGDGRHTGFGLFLIREILGITGMQIRETGEPGRGARFEIRIPRSGFRLKEGLGGAYDDARVQV
jgi:PAS domain S-box-containing protein